MLWQVQGVDYSSALRYSYRAGVLLPCFAYRRDATFFTGMLSTLVPPWQHHGLLFFIHINIPAACIFPPRAGYHEVYQGMLTGRYWR